ncbi:uncharacterized protein LOC135289041 [Passer domesticus]|uniref:uncharacterized protein LOC135289041 n=1 Tax=Passer domesticus TaxID=48849 RepID=UPI0030FED9C8
MNTENLEFITSNTLNPAQFLMGEPIESLEHDCLELISLQTKVREDLEDQPLTTGRILFIDGSSRVVDGKRASGYAIIDGKTLQIDEKGKLPQTWSAQSCEIYALKRGLDLLEGDRGTIYTDSQYAFRIVHTFGKIWEERGYLSSKGKSLAHENLVKSVLQSLQKPTEIAVVHIKGHQKGHSLEVKGNRLADQIGKEAALEPGDPVKVFKAETTPEEDERENPIFSEKELKAIKDLKLHQGQRGEWLTSDGQVFLNKALAGTVLTELHKLTHWGVQGLCDHFLRNNLCIGVYDLAKAITKRVFNLPKSKPESHEKSNTWREGTNSKTFPEHTNRFY